jgi:hypothetical protein
MLLDISDAEIYVALEGFFKLIVPNGTPIIRGQQNRIPEPNVPCVVMTTIGAPRRIGTNAENTEATVVDGEITGFEALVEADFEYSIQADFYSPVAESWAMAAELLWRGKIGWAFMPEGMKPLYSEGRQQLPIVGAENQWIQRWTMTLVLDYAPTFTQATQAATVATVIPEAIEVFFPPDYTADSDTTADSDATI